MRTFKLVLFTLVLVLGLHRNQFRSETTGTIRHSQGSLGAQAGVSVTATGTGYSRTVTTDDAGFFRLRQVPPVSSDYDRGDLGLRCVDQQQRRSCAGQDHSARNFAQAGGVATSVDVTTLATR